MLLVSEESFKKILYSIEIKLTDLTKNLNNFGYKFENKIYDFNHAITLSMKDKDYRQTNDKILEEIKIRISIRSSWGRPSMCIKPTNPDFMRSLSASDPLYILTDNDDRLNIVLSAFNEKFAKKIRVYQYIKNNQFRFDAIPKEQFGFIFSWNHVNYLPEIPAKQFLSECFDLLAVGGIVGFNYINCKNEKHGVGVENGFIPWMTTSIMEKLFLDIGYELVHSKQYENGMVYTEIKKPGILSSIKISPSVAKITKIS
jgi:hypothetical protein